MPKDTLEVFEDLNKSFETFKEKNDARLKELEAKGSADTLFEDQLKKINDAMDAQQKQMDDFAASQNRQTMFEVDGKSVPIEELDTKAAEWARVAAKERSERAPDNYGHKELTQYKAAFQKFLRKNEQLLSPDEIKALSVGSDADGGYLVTPDTSGRIVTRVFETSPMRQYAATQVISTDALEGLHDVDEADAGWVGETAARSDTDTPEIKKWRIPLFEQFAQPQATQKLLDDASVDVEAWLAGKVADKFARKESTAFVSGEGVEAPRGFTTYPGYTAAGVFQLGAIEQFASGANGAFVAAPNGGDVLIDAITGLKMQYRAGANWFMNRSTLGAVRKLKDSDGAYLWQPGIAAGQPSTLLAYGVAQFEDMVDFDSATGALAIAFGNMAETYQIVDRPGIRTLRDPFTNKPYVKFYSTKRVGGDVVNFESLKLISFTA
jgi:HK97 family phage major capsid protein